MKLRLQWICAAILLGLSAMVLRADDGGKKSPPPDAAKLQEANQLVNETFKDLLAAAKTGDAKAELAKKIMAAAGDEKDAASRFALHSKARDVAAEGGDFADAFGEIDQLDGEFEIDAIKMKTDAAVTAAKGIKSADDRKNFTVEVLKIMDDAAAHDRYDVAKTLGVSAVNAAHAANDGDLIRTTTAQVQQEHEVENGYVAIKKALTVLASKPDDADANLAVGKFRCFVQNQWQIGLPMLAQGSDAVLKALATKDVAGVTEANEQVKLGDGWWDVAEKLTAKGGRKIKEHAGKLYEAALPSLDKGLIAIRVQNRLDELKADTNAPMGNGAPAHIYAVCDDRFDLYINGVQMLTGSGDNGNEKDVNVADGDVITVKCINDFGQKGFICVIKLKSGAAIATSRKGAWQSYQPKDPDKWYALDGIEKLAPVIGGNTAWGGPVSEKSGVKATSIWGGRRDTCYLMLKVH